MKSDISSLVIRNKIYNFILDFPGAYPSQMEKKFGIPRTTLDYHLHFLERIDLIKIKSAGLYNRYYITGSASKNEKKIINILRKRTHWEIVFYLLNTGITSQIELCNELEKNPSTIAFFVSCLLENDIIEEVKKSKDNTFETKYGNKIVRFTKGREKIYRLTNPDQIYNLILTYKKSFLNDDISKSIFFLLKFYISEKIPQKRDCNSSALDYFLEKRLYEIFPHPYHC